MSYPPHHRKVENSDSEEKEILKLKHNEVAKMVTRAQSSSRYHGINLKHGSPNPGLGDCAFEAIIQNNNDRSCFMTKYPLQINHYR